MKNWRMTKNLLSVAMVFAAVGQAQAGVTLDGILSTGEYKGGVDHGVKSLQWYNDHHSE